MMRRKGLLIIRQADLQSQLIDAMNNEAGQAEIGELLEMIDNINTELEALPEEEAEEEEAEDGEAEEESSEEAPSNSAFQSFLERIAYNPEIIGGGGDGEGRDREDRGRGSRDREGRDREGRDREDGDREGRDRGRDGGRGRRDREGGDREDRDGEDRDGEGREGEDTPGGVSNMIHHFENLVEGENHRRNRTRRGGRARGRRRIRVTVPSDGGPPQFIVTNDGEEEDDDRQEFARNLMDYITQSIGGELPTMLESMMGPGEEYQDLLNMCQRVGNHQISLEPEYLETMPVRAFSELTATDSEEYQGQSCAVCTENFKDDDHVRVMPCRHIYHPDCIEPWFQDSVKCPICLVDLRDLIKLPDKVLKAIQKRVNQKLENSSEDPDLVNMENVD